eukprot:300764-Ditylum_brightwellii.AAC.1
MAQRLNNQQISEMGQRFKLNVFCSHGANRAKLNVQQWHRDSTISRNRKWGKRTTLNVFCSHGANRARLDVQQWHETQQSAGIGQEEMNDEE